MIVKNILKIKGDNAQAILNKIKGDNGIFDFNSINPLPTPLIRTVYPNGIITEEELLRQQTEDVPLEEYKSSLHITPQQSAQYKLDYGYDNWHDWRMANWGTPRNANNISMVNTHTIAFTTEQTPPLKLIQTLSEMFTGVTFKLYFLTDTEKASIVTFQNISDKSFAEVVSELSELIVLY